LPTTLPLTELEALLPTYAGAGLLERRVLVAADFEGSYPGTRVFERVLATTGRTVADVEGASATGSISIIALRLRGVGAQDLADAFVEASLAEVPGGTVTSRKVGGRDVRTLRWADDPLRADSSVTVMVTGDVVLVAGTTNGQALVDDALTAMFQPKLEASLPATLDGRPLERVTLPAEVFGTGGDMCWYLCPGEPQALAAKLGVDVSSVDVAVGLLRTPPGVLIVAMRLPSARTDRLIAARISVTAPNQQRVSRRLTIAGKAVTYVVYGPRPFGQEEYLYAHDHVLYLIRVDRGIQPVPAIVTAAIKALP
jgi:hypothetical protein